MSEPLIPRWWGTDDEDPGLRSGILPRRMFFYVDPKQMAHDSDFMQGGPDLPSIKGHDGRVQVPLGEGNLVSSQLEEGDLHSPVLDIDFQAKLVPSSTPGHYHLYLDGLQLPWYRYCKLLMALAEAGVISRYYADISIARQATFVRLPGVSKLAIIQDVVATLLDIGENFESDRTLHAMDAVEENNAPF